MEDPPGDAHPRQRPRPRAAREPEQHLLGLVVTGVGQPDRRGAVLVGGPLERLEPGVAGGGLGAAAIGCHLDADRHRGSQAQPATQVGDPRGTGGRAGGEAVVDADQAHPARRLEGGGPRQRQGVGPARAAHEDALVGYERGPHGPPDAEQGG